MYHQQQNKWYLQKFLLAYFEATLDFSRSELIAHNNLWLVYYGLVNLVKLNSSVSSKWASKNLWGYHLFCC